MVDEVVRTSPRSERDANDRLGGELMQLTRAVVKKHTLPPKNAYKYHLAQSSCILSRSFFHWNNNFACFKAALFTEEGRRLLSKNAKHVEFKFHNRATLKDLLLEFANKYKRCLKQDKIMCKVERDDSYSIVVIILQSWRLGKSL